MARFFTADFHLNSTAIIQYAGRPFKSGEKMAEAYIRSCNQQARDPSDMIIHVGDFFLKGADRHGIGDEGLGVSAKEYLSKINAQVFLIEGNQKVIIGNENQKCPQHLDAQGRLHRTCGGRVR